MHSPPDSSGHPPALHACISCRRGAAIPCQSRSVSSARKAKTQGRVGRESGGCLVAMETHAEDGTVSEEEDEGPQHEGLVEYHYNGRRPPDGTHHPFHCRSPRKPLLENSETTLRIFASSKVNSEKGKGCGVAFDEISTLSVQKRLAGFHARWIERHGHSRSQGPSRQGRANLGYHVTQRVHRQAPPPQCDAKGKEPGPALDEPAALPLAC